MSHCVWNCDYKIKIQKLKSKVYCVCCLILLCFIISIQIAITIDQTTLTDARALIMDYVVWGIFTIDIIIRFIVCPNKLKYFIDPFNIIDLVSILPNYIFMPIYYTTRSPSVLKYDRMIKCLIILKLFRCIPTMRILFVALSKSWRELGIKIKKIQNLDDFSKNIYIKIRF